MSLLDKEQISTDIYSIYDVNIFYKSISNDLKNMVGKSDYISNNDYDNLALIVQNLDKWIPLNITHKYVKYNDMVIHIDILKYLDVEVEDYDSIIHASVSTDNTDMFRYIVKNCSTLHYYIDDILKCLTPTNCLTFLNILYENCDSFKSVNILAKIQYFNKDLGNIFRMIEKYEGFYGIYNNIFFTNNLQLHCCFLNKYFDIKWSIIPSFDNEYNLNEDEGGDGCKYKIDIFINPEHKSYLYNLIFSNFCQSVVTFIFKHIDLYCIDLKYSFMYGETKINYINFLKSHYYTHVFYDLYVHDSSIFDNNDFIDKDTPLHTIIKQSKCIETLEKEFDKVSDKVYDKLFSFIKSKNESGDTPLHLIIKYYNIGDIDENIEFIRDVFFINNTLDIQNNTGDTPLHTALIYKKYNINLISNNNINVQNIDGNTPLHLYIKYYCNNIKAEHIVNLATTQNILTKNSTEFYPIHLYLYESKTCVLSIIKNLCDIKTLNKRTNPINKKMTHILQNTRTKFIQYIPHILIGQLRIHIFSVYNDFLNLYKLCVKENKNDAEITQTNKYYKYINNYIDIIKFFINNYNCKLKNSDGDTSLNLAIKRLSFDHDKKNILRLNDVILLFINDNNINISNKGGFTPLGTALKNNNVQILKNIYIDKKCDYCCIKTENISPILFTLKYCNVSYKSLYKLFKILYIRFKTLGGIFINCKSVLYYLNTYETSRTYKNKLFYINKIIKLFIDHGVDITNDHSNLHHIAACSCTKLFEIYMDNGLNLDKRISTYCGICWTCERGEYLKSTCKFKGTLLTFIINKKIFDIEILSKLLLTEKYNKQINYATLINNYAQHPKCKIDTLFKMCEFGGMIINTKAIYLKIDCGNNDHYICNRFMKKMYNNYTRLIFKKINDYTCDNYYTYSKYCINFYKLMETSINNFRSYDGHSQTDQLCLSKLYLFNKIHIQNALFKLKSTFSFHILLSCFNHKPVVYLPPEILCIIYKILLSINPYNIQFN